MSQDLALDVIIVGAGVLGCSLALELARRSHRVVVLDSRGGPGYGSTSASSAIIRYHYSHLPESAIAWEAGHRWQDWERHLGVVDPIGMAQFVPSGALVLEGPGYDIELFVSILRELNIDVDELTAAELRERFPGLDPQRIGPATVLEDDHFWAEPTGELAGMYVEGAGHIDDPQLATHNLAHAAEANGAVFRFGCEVVAVLRDGGRVSGVELAGGERVHARVVVNVAGPWSAQLNRLADVLEDFTTTTRPLEHEVVSVPAPADFRLGHGGTCVTDADFATYFRVHAGDTIIVGGLEPPCDELVFLDSPDDAATSISQKTWELQTLRLARRLPGLGIPSTPRGIIGVYDVTEDWIPIYDRTALDGYYVAIGTSGHGFKQAPFVGEIMARLIEQVEGGHDHDREPLVVKGSWTGVDVDLAHFSRLRGVVPQRGMG
ncbi:unannotated protein [freshwater metagenome]|jgi:sarcosine oxidase subunit beta|uniref:Unannotated protein n=1 Tax=freshwater metagenome TaxID=449393 RepID=A0A6J7KMK4_9ZZZZ|nr:FAD-dependent oxidoreductase [Actinomycetota bacterium]MSW37612.1 FAD-dependent oxidoreductase [Actinomycetota bacterium]MSX38334.1 FAD-dependent oxidoreductase [Actinomycetota bacterium]